MLTTDIEKVVSALQGFVSRDAEMMTRHVNPSKFIQHNPSVADGIEGLKEELSHSVSVGRLLAVDASPSFTPAQ
jgi:hypothetical protein